MWAGLSLAGKVFHIYHIVGQYHPFPCHQAGNHWSKERRLENHLGGNRGQVSFRLGVLTFVCLLFVIFIYCIVIPFNSIQVVGGLARCPEERWRAGVVAPSAHAGGGGGGGAGGVSSKMVFVLLLTCLFVCLICFYETYCMLNF